MNHLIKNKALSKVSRVLSVNEDKFASASVSSEIEMHAERDINIEEVYAAEIKLLRERVTREAIAEAKQSIEATIEQEISKKKIELDAEASKKLQQYDMELKQLTKVIESVKDHKYMSSGEIEASVVRLVLECLYKLTGEKEIYQSIVENAVSTALSNIRDNDHTLLKASVQDESFILEATKKLEAKNLKLQIDKNLAPGTCLVESGFSRIDSSVLSKLDNLKSEILNVYKNGTKTLSEG